MGAIISRIRSYLPRFGTSLLPLLRSLFPWLTLRPRSRHEYSPLGKRQIRLLVLYPKTIFGPDLRLSLVAVPLDTFKNRSNILDDDGQGPPRHYNALSYTWEEDIPANRSELVCDGQTIANVPLNLITSLKYLQRHGFTRADGTKSDRPMYIWADSVCIDQQNNAEKAHQIGLMAEIYSSADDVVIWLGIPFAEEPEGEGRFLPRLLATLGEAKSILPEASLDDSKVIQTASREFLAPKIRALQKIDWEPLRVVLSSSWFDRKWIVQEAVLAKNPVILVAGGVVTLKALTDVTVAISAYGLHGLTPLATDLENAAAIGYRLYNLSHINAVAHYRNKNQMTLLDVAKMTRMFKCTQAVDNVYGILALCPDEMASMTRGAFHGEDMYDVPAAEVFLRFAKYHVDMGDLAFLALAPDNCFPESLANMRTKGTEPPPRNPNLPSWVPDLCRQEMDVIASHSMKEFHFCAGGRDTGPGNYRIVNRVLQCRGRLVDTVAETIDIFPSNPMPPLPDPLPPQFEGIDVAALGRFLRQAAWYRDCARLACASQPGSGTCVADMSAERFADFWKTITCERLALLDRVDPQEDHSAEMRTFFTNFEEFVSTTDLEVAAAAVAGYMPLAVIMDISASYLATRRFGVAASGRLLVVPAEARVGDQLVILPGVEVPFTVRRVEGCRFELIGDSYLSRMMDGEALEQDCELSDVFLI